MISYIIFPVIFAIAYAIKGGQGRMFFRNWDRENPVSEKLASTILVFVTLCATTVFYQVNLGLGSTAYWSIAFITLAWIASIAPSMGEEYRAMLGKPDHYLKWMPEKRTVRILGKKFQWVEGQDYGMKKAVQRGVWMGACMTVATGYIPFLWWSLAFMPVSYVLLNYGPRFWLDRWGWAEMGVGALCFGVPFAMMI